MRWLCYGHERTRFALIGVLLVSSAVFAQAEAPNEAVDLLCLTDRPAITVGESVKLHAMAGGLDGNQTAQMVSFDWQVKDGAVQGSGDEVDWDLSRVGIEPRQSHRMVTATVRAKIAGQPDTQCSVDVFIGQKQDGDKTTKTRGGLVSARRYLLPAQQEEAGYGLYSYLLLSAKPKDDEETVRYLKTLEACLHGMRKLANLGRYIRPSRLNATHIPITEAPKGNEDDPDFAKKVLSVYDFDRAMALLNKFERTYDRGPYLVSLKSPLTQASEPVSTHILQNFTGIVPNLAARGVKDFEFLAAQQRTWTEQSMRTFSSKLRNWIAVAGKEAPEVAMSLKTIIQFVKIGE